MHQIVCDLGLSPDPAVGLSGELTGYSATCWGTYCAPRGVVRGIRSYTEYNYFSEYFFQYNVPLLKLLNTWAYSHLSMGTSRIAVS